MIMVEDSMAEDAAEEEVVVEEVEMIDDRVEATSSWSVAHNIKDSIYGRSVLWIIEAMPTRGSMAEEEAVAVVVIREEAMSSLTIPSIKHTNIYHRRRE